MEAVEEVRAAAADVEAVGFGIPSLVRPDTGVSVWSNHLPIDDVPFRDLMSERLGLPVVVDNDANVAALAEHRHGAARGADHAVMLALGTGIGGGLVLDGRIYRGAAGFGGELGHMVVDHDGEDCPGDCPGRGCLEVLASGTAIGRAGEAVAAEQPDSTLGRRAAGGGEITGGLVTELAHDGDEQALAVLAEIGRRLGAGLCGLVNIFDPEVIVIGGGAVAAGELLLAPARGVVAERALPPAREAVRIVPAHFGDESGMLGAALMALEMADRMSLVVCPTPIGNLEDVTLRVLSALREADVVACEDTRRTRMLLDRYGVSAKLVSYHEHNEEARAAELVERMGGPHGGAGVRRRDAARVRPRLRARARLRGRRAAGGGAAGALRGDRRARGVGAAGRSLALRRVPAAQEGRAAHAALRARRDARGLRVAAPGAGHAGAACRGRPRASGGRVPRADQGCTRRWCAAARPSWPSATPARRPRARSCWCWGRSAAAPRGGRAMPGRPGWSSCAAWWSGRAAARGADGRRRADRRQRERALPGAHGLTF